MVIWGFWYSHSPSNEVPQSESTSSLLYLDLSGFWLEEKEKHVFLLVDEQNLNFDWLEQKKHLLIIGS